MNWLFRIIILHFIGQAFSDLSCLKTSKCICHKHIGKEEVEANCGSSTVAANLGESIATIDCDSDQIQWEQSFNTINVTTLWYSNCPMLDMGIYQTTSSLGIHMYETMRLKKVKLNDSLMPVYLSNLESLKLLEIESTKLLLTNESFEGTPNLTKLFLRQNSIEELPKGVFKHLIHLQVLDLGGNLISEIDNSLFEDVPLKGLILDSNRLKILSLNIQSLKHLDLSNNFLTSIAVENLNNLVELSLNKNLLITMPEHPFRNTSLEFIKYNFGNFTIPHRFLTSLNRLSKVQLKSLKLHYVPENMIWDSPNILELSLNSNYLKELPELFFRDSGNLQLLDLSNNQLEKVSHELLRPLKKLKNLDLSNNLIVQIKDLGLGHLKSLESLNLEKNKIMNFEGEALNIPELKVLKLAYNKIDELYKGYKFSFNYVNKVESVDLSHNSINHIGPNWMVLTRLKNINLSNNNFTILKVEDFQYLNQYSHTNFRSNPLHIFYLSHLELIANAQTDDLLNTINRQITLSGSDFLCDCRNYDFAKYVHNQKSKAVYNYIKIEQELRCHDGTKFEDMNMKNLTCPWDVFENSHKVECSECLCTYQPYDNSAIMNCSNRKLISAPKTIVSSRYINYTELNLSNNYITELPNYEHYNIGKLDVSHNNLTTINITQLPKKLMVSF